MRTVAAVLCLSLVGIPAISMASFEMALISDSTKGVVHRYDLDTGAYLGSFGNGDLVGTQAITIDQSRQWAFVGTGTTQGGLAIYIYNTGEFIASSDLVSGQAQDLAFSSSHGLLAALPGPIMSRLPNVPSSLGVVNYVGTATITGVGIDSSGNVLGYAASTGQISRWAPGGGSVAGSTTVTGGGSGIAVKGTSLLHITNDLTVRNINTLNFGTATGFTPVTPFTQGIDVEFGHAGTAWALGISGGSPRLQRYRLSSGGAGPFYDAFGLPRSLSQVTTATGLAIVVAPEPLSVASIGIGLGFLLRRRKASKI